MPRAAAHSALSRQWEILKRLPTRAPGITASEIVSHLSDAGIEVTKRTVERDLADLATPFGLACNDQSKPYGWYWVDGRAAVLPGMALAEALSLSLVESALKPVLPTSLQGCLAAEFTRAREKLSSLPNNRRAQWAKRVRYLAPSLPFLPPAISPRVLESTQEALARGVCITLRYLGPGAKRAKELTLHPLAFIQRGPISYLLATAFEYEDPRLYALHRIQGARLLDKAAREPRGFDLDAYLASGGLEFGEGGQIQLKARVSSDLACLLQESPLTSGQKLTPTQSGDYQLTARLKDSWQLHFWILSQGAAITVESPASLRDRIRDTHLAAAKNYD